MMMSVILPLDMVEEILSRVPATALKRLRSTCKLWKSLFKDQRFTEKHLSKAPKESMVLMLKEYRVFSMSLNLKIAPPSLEFKGGLGLKDSHSSLEEFDVDLVVHCEGLLLCITKDNRPVVWNPCLGETRWIPPKTSYNWRSTFALGYKKTKSGHNYKMLMFWTRHDKLPHELDGYEIYDFNSDSWRVIDNIVTLDCSLISPIGVSLKGNSYWLAYDTKVYDEFLLCFDFTAERFKPMCLPLVVDQMALSVVGEKQLSVLSKSDSTLTLWVTNKIDTDIKGVLEWSKSFTVDISTHDKWFPFFFSFLFVEEKKVALCCDRILETGINKFFIRKKMPSYMKYQRMHGHTCQV